MRFSSSGASSPSASSSSASSSDSSASLGTLRDGGLRLIVVHGGGPFIARGLEAAGIESRFVRGLRVTDAAAIAVVERELTMLGKHLAQEIGDALGLTGRDGGLLRAEVADPALGHVGRVTSVRADVLTRLADAGLTPVLACLAVDAEGEPLNVNADEVAGAVAAACRARVAFLTDVPGVLDDPSDPDSRIAELTEADARARIEDGRIAGVGTYDELTRTCPGFSALAGIGE